MARPDFYDRTLASPAVLTVERYSARTPEEEAILGALIELAALPGSLPVVTPLNAPEWLLPGAIQPSDPEGQDGFLPPIGSTAGDAFVYRVYPPLSPLIPLPSTQPGGFSEVDRLIGESPATRSINSAGRSNSPDGSVIPAFWAGAAGTTPGGYRPQRWTGFIRNETIVGTLYSPGGSLLGVGMEEPDGYSPGIYLWIPPNPLDEITLYVRTPGGAVLPYPLGTSGFLVDPAPGSGIARVVSVSLFFDIAVDPVAETITVRHADTADGVITEQTFSPGYYPSGGVISSFSYAPEVNGVTPRADTASRLSLLHPYTLETVIYRRLVRRVRLAQRGDQHRQGTNTGARGRIRQGGAGYF